MQTIIKTPAKINLYLHITGRDNRGYHLLDTLVCFLPNLSDTIMVSTTDHKNHIVETRGLWKEYIKGPNIIEAVLNKFAMFLNTKFHIILEKNIPIGAGLGGGSGNAAYLLLYLLKHYQINISDSAISQMLLDLGSDVPMFQYRKALYASGTGNIISPLKSFPNDIFALLVYPKELLDTKTVYQQYNSQFATAIKHNYSPDLNELIALLKNSNNALYSSSVKLLPELNNIIKRIDSLDGCILARMSGSGSTSFGLFSDQNKLELAEITLKKEWPEFFITTSRIE
jgi:4-diphosphocytidyl-2-C-methyl-D-erythritol kinase